MPTLGTLPCVPPRLAFGGTVIADDGAGADDVTRTKGAPGNEPETDVVGASGVLGVDGVDGVEGGEGTAGTAGVEGVMGNPGNEGKDGVEGVVVLVVLADDDDLCFS